MIAKDWPQDIKQRMEEDAEPLLLVLDRPFATFDPGENGYAIIWLSDFRADPQQIRAVLQTLARKTKRGDDVIAYLAQVAERRQHEAAAEKAGETVGLLARFASFVEIKPQVFGVSIDLKALLRDLAEHR